MENNWVDNNIRQKKLVILGKPVGKSIFFFKSESEFFKFEFDFFYFNFLKFEWDFLKFKCDLF